MENETIYFKVLFSDIYSLNLPYNSESVDALLVDEPLRTSLGNLVALLVTMTGLGPPSCCFNV